MEAPQTLIAAQEEISSLKTALSQKNSTLNHLISTHETLKTTSKAQITKLESENKTLISALDEANLKNEERETKISAYKEEIQRLRSFLEESQKKIKKTEELSQTGKESRKREELLTSFEEEREKIEEKLKWKCEQFSHLEDAFKKSQNDLKTFKAETEKEKSEFITKINDLEANLDLKSRILEDLKSRFELCNHALSTEQTKRKLVQVELKEIKEKYNLIVTDFETARLAVESVTAKRDADVADLRGILADKSLKIKEIEFEKEKIEIENKELKDCLKEYREFEIGGVEKLKKFKGLERKIRVRDLEIENLKKEVSDCLVKLNEKEAEIRVKEDEIEEKEGLIEKIMVRDLEIENLKKELNDCLVKLNEKVGDNLNLSEIRVKGVEIEEKEGLIEKVRIRDLEIENLKKELGDCLVKLNEKESENLILSGMRVKEVEIEEKEGLIEKNRVLEGEIENLKNDLSDKEGLAEIVRVKDVEIENLKKNLSEKEGLIEIIRVKDVEIENLKKDLDDHLNKLNENDGLIEIIKVKDVEIENLKKDLDHHLNKLNEKNGLVEKIKVKEVEIENLKKDLNDCLSQLSNKNKLIENLKLKYSKIEEENLVSKEELAMAWLVIKGNFEGHFEKCLKNDHEILKNKILKKEIEECKERERTLVRENEILVCEARERESVFKERENTIEEHKLSLEREKAEKEKLICILREREEILERENKKLVSLVREREGIFEEVKERKEREEILERENKKLGSVVREREVEIEEIKDAYSRLKLENETLEEERKRYIEIENELTKKLVEIKFKLDPLEGKLEENLYLLVEALGNSNDENELMQTKLHELISNYYLQEHEIEFKKALISEMEIKLISKEEQIERENFENENEKIGVSSEIENLRGQNEKLKLQILDLHCGISSLFCVDGEIKAMLENISQKINFEDGEIKPILENISQKLNCEEAIVKPNSPLRNKAVIPAIGIRSVLKENNNF